MPVIWNCGIILRLYIRWEPRNGKSCSRKLLFTYYLFTFYSELLFKSFSELLLAAFIQCWKHTDHFTNNRKNILCPENLITDWVKLESDFTIIFSIWEYKWQFALIWTKWLRSQLNTCLVESSRHLSDNLGMYKTYLQQIKKTRSLKTKSFKHSVL